MRAAETFSTCEDVALELALELALDRARTGGSRVDRDVSVVGPNSDRADAACDRVDVDCCILRPIVVYGLIDAEPSVNR